ncbi:AzlD domain-containing protein [Aliishimia ponticola]|uniref:AzlD domain-containing protein n=1 Tax=Aliishimia ponticola TaxID=2499833 RepID=A0A4S4N8R4_9RHOB|nr:AzlD domain-containing protein [Aliishimia ponticola]THH34381.1 AzlD domain-containing protein [Aliishimia ponticola]
MTGTLQLWIIIIGLGLGSFLIRFLFLGFVGDRPLPPWLLRHLRYTAVAILPALVAPLVVWPAGNDGVPHPSYMIAAAAAFLLGYFTKNVALAVAGGALSLYVLLTVF